MLNESIDNFDVAKIPAVENILRTLNKFVYYSLDLCMEALKSGIIDSLDRLIGILEAQVGKENQFATLAHETISLLNSILALRTQPNPLMYNNEIGFN
jgi:hypothetical protein